MPKARACVNADKQNLNREYYKDCKFKAKRVDKRVELALLDDILKQIDVATERGCIGKHYFTSGVGARLRRIVEEDKKDLEISETYVGIIGKEINAIYYFLEHGEFPKTRNSYARVT